MSLLLNIKSRIFFSKKNICRRFCELTPKFFKMSKVLEIDGSMLEGGGQILRMSIALSALLGQPVRIYNIRAKRSNPGLRPQHLSGVKLVAAITNAKLEGAEIGSTEIFFHPGPICEGKYDANPGTAGSVMLLFQVSFPVLLFANQSSELYLQGGTNADMAPQIDEMIQVFKPIVEKLGAKFSIEIIKRGYYPKGGGKVLIKVDPVVSHLIPFQSMDPGSLVAVKGYSFTAGSLPIKIAHIMADSAANSLQTAYPSCPVAIDRVHEPPNAAFGIGAGIVLVAETDNGCLLGGSGLKKRDSNGPKIGQDAAFQIIEEIKKGACVDSFVQDQLVIFMALAKGHSKVRIGTPTLHTKTAIYIAELMTKARFQLTPSETDESTILECEGIGLERKQ